MVKRIYVEKRAGFDVPARQLLEDFRETLDVKLSGVRLLVRYDVEGLSDEDFIKVRDIVFREPNVAETSQLPTSPKSRPTASTPLNHARRPSTCPRR